MLTSLVTFHFSIITHTKICCSITVRQNSLCNDADACRRRFRVDNVVRKVHPEAAVDLEIDQT